MVRHKVIVWRERPDLYAALLQAFASRPSYSVILDRREGERRGVPRRAADRREPQPDLQKALFVIYEARRG